MRRETSAHQRAGITPFPLHTGIPLPLGLITPHTSKISGGVAVTSGPCEGVWSAFHRSSLFSRTQKPQVYGEHVELVFLFKNNLLICLIIMFELCCIFQLMQLMQWSVFVCIHPMSGSEMQVMFILDKTRIPTQTQKCVSNAHQRAQRLANAGHLGTKIDWGERSMLSQKLTQRSPNKPLDLFLDPRHCLLPPAPISRSLPPTPCLNCILPHGGTSDLTWPPTLSPSCQVQLCPPPPQSRSSDPTRKQPTVKLSHISHSFLNNMNGSGKACDVWWVGRSIGVCASMQLPSHVSEFFSKLF